MIAARSTRGAISLSSWVIECPPANVDLDVVALDPPKLLKSLPECGYVSLKFWVALRMCHKHANTPHAISWLLRVRDERPCCRSAAEKRDEIPSPHEAFPTRRTTTYHIEWRLFAPQQTGSPNVRFGSKADIAASQRNVRFTPKSGHWNLVA